MEKKMDDCWSEWSDWSDSTREKDLLDLENQQNKMPDIQEHFEDIESITAVIHQDMIYETLLIETLTSPDMNIPSGIVDEINTCDQLMSDFDMESNIVIPDSDTIEALVKHEMTYQDLITKSFYTTPTKHENSSSDFGRTDNGKWEDDYTNCHLFDDVDSVDVLIKYEQMYNILLENAITCFEKSRSENEHVDNNKQEDESFDELDNIPLADLVNVIRKDNTVDLDKTVDYTVIIEDQQGYEYDTDITDATTLRSVHTPTSPTTLSNRPDELFPKSGCKRKAGVRDTNWKRRGKHIKRARRSKTNRNSSCKSDDSDGDNEQNIASECPNNRDETVDNEINNIEKAKELSLRQKQLNDLLFSYHKRRLKKILASNMLKKKAIPADGNCLFAAVLDFLGWPMSVQDLRSKVAQHIEDHILDYIPFVTFQEILAPEEELVLFASIIEEIREDGKWNTYMSDFVPLCIANIFQRSIRIFSSRPFQPLLEVEPHITTVLNESPIILAHIAVHGTDHYDTVTQSVLGTNEDSLHQDNDSSQEEDTDEEEYFLTDNERTPSKQQKRKTSKIKLTPHKDAAYKSPKRKLLRRKQVAAKHQWKSTLRKNARSKGLQYTSMRGKPIEARTVKEVDCSKCRFKCSQKISDVQRQSVFQTYWAIGDFVNQRHFICTHIETNEPQRCLKARRLPRTVSKYYYITVGLEKIRVCKNFFIKTLDIGRKTIDNALKMKTHGVYVGKDNRGKHTPSNKTSAADIAYVKEHIESFPTMDSHYTRKDSNKKYLQKDLNIRQLHALYVEKCKEHDRAYVLEKIYRNIFCQEYNMSFFHPKKDQCQVCNHYENLKTDGNIDIVTEQKYQEHQDRKTKSRLEKEKDKKRAKTDLKFHASAFYLQAVLTTPCSLVGELYYKRKLCCYNLSFYELGSGKGTCYLWDETQGRRGSCEIGSCILLHLNAISSNSSPVAEVTYYCDTCGGQNRNQYVAATLLYCVQQNPSIKIINQKFLESGHSEMECDSIHSTIEHAKKLTKVYVPSQWETVITLSRRKQPYVVVPLKYVDFLDFKKYKNENLGNMKTDTNGQRVNWLKIKWIQVRKYCPESIFVSTDFETCNLQEMCVAAKKTRGRDQTKARPTGSNKNKPCPAYNEKLLISAAKKADLLSLCDSGTISKEYKPYYQSINSSKTVKDKLPAPSISDCEDSD